MTSKLQHSTWFHKTSPVALVFFFFFTWGSLQKLNLERLFDQKAQPYKWGLYPECSHQQALKSQLVLSCPITTYYSSLKDQFKVRMDSSSEALSSGCFLSCLIFAWIKTPSTSDAWDSWGIKFTYYQSRSHFWPLPSPTGTKVWAGFSPYNKTSWHEECLKMTHFERAKVQLPSMPQGKKIACKIQYGINIPG